ncbi:uncharacterized protein [Euwallacea fornicatus]|uniref:uncharacterized protein isoform X2 n=1 Tax=Euwallacea fornicatus TaxID=995702 RepID=UPI00338FF234
MTITSYLFVFVLTAASSYLVGGDSNVNQIKKSFGSEEDNASSNEVENMLMLLKDLVRLQHLDNKEEAIVTFMEEFERMDISNITFVGSQNIYSQDGSLKEVRTIELFIPNKQKDELSMANDNMADDAIEDSIEMRDWFRFLSTIGLNVEMIVYKFDEEEHITHQLYLNDHIFAVAEDNFYVINKTIVVDTKDEVEKDYERRTMGQTAAISSYLVFDKDKKFIKSKSTVEPALFGVVDSEMGQPEDQIIQSALKSLVDRMLESNSKDNVPEEIRQDLEKQYPGSTFMVIENYPEGAYISDFFHFGLTYEFIEIGQNNKYTVCGRNISRTGN